MVGGAAAAGVVNVKEFGAKGDGTTDDSPAIAKAIAAVPPASPPGPAGEPPIGGGVLYFPAGIYKVTQAIVINRSNVSVLGDGPNATEIVSYAAADDVFRVGDGSNQDPNRSWDLSVSDLSVRNGVVKTAGAAVLMQNVLYAAVSNVWIDGMACGIRTIGPGAIQFYSDLYIHNTNLNGGISFDIAGGNDHYLYGVLALNETGTGPTVTPCQQPSAGLLIRNTQGTWIEDSDFMQCGDGLRIEPDPNSPCWFLFAANTAFDSGCGRGILINAVNNTTYNGVAPIRSLNFEGCWTATNASNGVEIRSDGGPGLVEGVAFLNHRSFGNKRNGFSIVGGNGISIDCAQVSGNSLEALGSAPGAAAGIAVGANVTGFAIRSTRSGAYAAFPNTQAYGLAIAEGCTNFILVGNDFCNNYTGEVQNLSPCAIAAIAGNLPLSMNMEGAATL